MDIITNKFLQSISAVRVEKLYDPSANSSICKEQDTKMYEQAGNAFIGLLSNKKLKSLFKEISSQENGSHYLTILALKYYYIKEYQIEKKRIERELNLCEQILKTDIIHRNMNLAEAIYKEKLKLEFATDLDEVKFLVRYLKDVYDILFPKESNRKKYVKIYEIMHQLEIHGKKPFESYAKIAEYIDKQLDIKPNYSQKEANIIKDRIEHYLKDD